MTGSPTVSPGLADINREAYLYFGAGAAVAWQMADPGVDRGVARHSTTLERPLDRLRATMTYIYAVSLGDDEAAALGIAVEPTRWLILACVTLITAGSVAVAGVIGWIGLVVPHLARMLVGPDHRLLLPAAALIGAGYTILIDDLARTATLTEIPLGGATLPVNSSILAALVPEFGTELPANTPMLIRIDPQAAPFLTDAAAGPGGETAELMLADLHVDFVQPVGATETAPATEVTWLSLAVDAPLGFDLDFDAANGVLAPTITPPAGSAVTTRVQANGIGADEDAVETVFSELFPNFVGGLSSSFSAFPLPGFLGLDLSVIDELPPGRKPVVTVALPETRRDEVIERVRGACESGQQAYWVCPLIAESELQDSRAAEESLELLQKALPALTIGLVHGRMPAREKERAMRAFKSGEIDVLVATTVIEVGVDVPNATLMIIESAERLGLSQLHQLRGRVGRGAASSHCVLLYRQPLGQLAKSRISVLRETNDGFIVAERDLELRGPGELLGTRQTGLPQYRIADLARDAHLMPAVQTAARSLSGDDSDALIRRWLGNSPQYGKV